MRPKTPGCCSISSHGALWAQDEGSGAELAIVTDRAQGGGSLGSGQAELMVHRRTLLDDQRGVGEPINETMCGCSACACAGLVARGTHYLTLQVTLLSPHAYAYHCHCAAALPFSFTCDRDHSAPLKDDASCFGLVPVRRSATSRAVTGKAGQTNKCRCHCKAPESPCNDVQGSKSAAEYRRTLQQRVNDPVILLFGRADNSSSQALQQGQTSFLQHPQGLPGNVHLLTLKDNGDGQILLRLAHLYQVCLPAPSLLLNHYMPGSKDLLNATMQSSVRSVCPQLQCLGC